MMDYKDYAGGATKTNHFWFKSRINFLSWLLEKALTQKAQGRRLKILNIGAGVGDDLEMFHKFGDIYALDLDQKTLDLVPEHLVKEKICADACAIPYQDCFFDAVVAFDIFEHIPDDKKAVAEVRRVLKKDGVLVFTVPAIPWLFGAHDRMLGHERRYNKLRVTRLFREFKQEKLGSWFFALFFPAAIQRILTKKSQKYDLHQHKIPAVIHSFLYHLVMVENWLIKKGIPMPLGLTIYGIYRKNN